MYQDPKQYNNNLLYFINNFGSAEISQSLVSHIISLFSEEEMEYSIRSLNLPLTLLDEIKEKIAKLKILLS